MAAQTSYTLIDIDYWILKSAGGKCGRIWRKQQMNHNEMDGTVTKASCAVEGMLLLQEWFEEFRLWLYISYKAGYGLGASKLPSPEHRLISATSILGCCSWHSTAWLVTDTLPYGYFWRRRWRYWLQWLPSIFSSFCHLNKHLAINKLLATKIRYMS